MQGTVTDQNGTRLCAMILANGQFMFTCDDKLGRYDLNVPLDENGKITFFAFCNGLAPFQIEGLQPSEAANIGIIMEPAPLNSPEMIVTRQFGTATENPGWVKISGTVTNENGKPLCAMVLANGQHTFTCAGDGRYDLEVPPDANGEITLFGFCAGMLPFTETLEP